MADKKASGITILPVFVDGEQPTAYKFNTIGAQFKVTLSLLYQILGFLWSLLLVLIYLL
jgi:hypothetical protein